MNVVQNVREIADLVKKYNDQDLYERIIDLREQVLSLREENLGLKEQVAHLGSQSDTQSRLTRQGNTYVLKAEDGTESGPFCMPCWDFDRKLVNLHTRTYTHNGREEMRIRCTICAARKPKE